MTMKRERLRNWCIKVIPNKGLSGLSPLQIANLLNLVQDNTLSLTTAKALYRELNTYGLKVAEEFVNEALGQPCDSSAVRAEIAELFWALQTE